MTTLKLRLPAIALAGVLAMATQAAAQWTCDVVADNPPDPNADCSAPGAPRPCCTGPGAGACGPHLAKQGDYDPEDPDSDCTGMMVPKACCTGAGVGTCIAPLLGPRFADPVNCNDDGDCLFVAQPYGARDKLYKYPKVGDAEVIAKANGASVPGCPAFRSSNVFRFWSLNNANDVAFKGALDDTDGGGVFKKPSGGPLEVCAAPGFAGITAITHVAQINKDGKVAFVGKDTERCVFLCDSCSAACPPAACTKKVCEGDLTDDGMGGMNEICEIFSSVGLGDTDAIALSAAIGDTGTCANRKDAILYKTDALPNAKEVAVVGQPCPTPPGGNYTGFEGAGLNEDPHQVAPLVNVSNAQNNMCTGPMAPDLCCTGMGMGTCHKVGFQAVCNVPSPGNPRTTGIFLWEPLTMTTKAIVLKGDPTPPDLVGDGTIGNLRRFQTSDADQAIFRTTVAGNMPMPTPSPPLPRRATFCLFRFDATDETVVCNDYPPPFGDRYVNIRDPGASSDGNQVCARVRIKDDKTAAPPLAKTAVIRCHP